MFWRFEYDDGTWSSGQLPDDIAVVLEPVLVIAVHATSPMELSDALGLTKGAH